MCMCVCVCVRIERALQNDLRGVDELIPDSHKFMIGFLNVEGFIPKPTTLTDSTQNSIFFLSSCLFSKIKLKSYFVLL